MTLFFQGLRSWQKIRFFPFTTQTRTSSKYTAFIGLGSNIDGEKLRFKKLFRTLMNDKRIKVLSTSPILVNEAFGFKEQKDFSNAVIFVQSLLHARALLKVLLFYELKFKRKRTFKNAPRTLDLDLLYFSKKSKNDTFCTLPHPGANKRLSVILPMCALNFK